MDLRGFCWHEPFAPSGEAFSPSGEADISEYIIHLGHGVS